SFARAVAMSPRRYLVTGGTGFIGAELCRRLVAAGHSVRVIDNNTRGALRRIAGLESHIDFIRVDGRDWAAGRLARRGVDSVIHLAAINGTEHFYREPELVLDVAIRGTFSVIDACRTESVRELVLVSSSEVYQTPPTIPTAEDVPLSVPDVLNPRYSY